MDTELGIADTNLGTKGAVDTNSWAGTRIRDQKPVQIRFFDAANVIPVRIAVCIIRSVSNGRLGAAKRLSPFSELTEDEIARLETIVLAAMHDTPT